MGDVTDGEIDVDAPAESSGVLAALTVQRELRKRRRIEEPMAPQVLISRLHLSIDARGVEARVDGIEEAFRVLGDSEAALKGREPAIR